MPNGNGQEPATKADVAALERLAEAIHDSETRLLKAFYGFTRLLEVEKRLNMPGQ